MTYKKDHPLYSTWGNMKTRCYSPTATNYHRYGGRGITICDRWRGDFWAFVSDMGEKPSPLHTVDRIDNDGPYSPENCKWSTRKEQSLNTRRVLWVEVEGVRMRAADLGAAAGIQSRSIKARVKRGMSLEQIVSTERIKTPPTRHAMEAAWEKHRNLTHCKRGHEFTLENTRTDKRGSRVCIECSRQRKRAWRQGISFSTL